MTVTDGSFFIAERAAARSILPSSFKGVQAKRILYSSNDPFAPYKVERKVSYGFPVKEYKVSPGRSNPNNAVEIACVPLISIGETMASSAPKVSANIRQSFSRPSSP